MSRQTLKKRLLASLLTLVIAFFASGPTLNATETDSGQPVVTKTLSTKEVYKQLLHGTVWVHLGYGAGTGWIVDKQNGLIITNQHVIEGKTQVDIYVPKFENGKLATNKEDYTEYSRPLAATVVDSSQAIDLAILRVPHLPDYMHELELAGESATAADPIHAIGAQPTGNQGAFVYANGNVRQVSRGYNSNGFECEIIETTVPINPGNSGGALVNDSGHVVGVASMGYQEKYQNISGGIELVELKRYLELIRNLYPPRTDQQLVHAAKRHFDEARYDNAMDFLTGAIQQNHENADAYQLRGFCFLWKNDVATAKMDFDRAIELSPGNAEAFRGRSRVHELQGKLDLALEDASRSIQLNPKSGLAYGRRAMVLRAENQLDSAISDCDKAIELDPTLHAVVNLRGMMRMNQSDHAGALEDFLQACRLRQESMYYNNAGYAHMQMKNSELAKEWLAYALRLDATNTLAMENLGLLHHSEEQYETAIAFLDEAVRINPKSLRAFWSRALCHVDSGNNQAGLADYNRALKLQPNHTQLLVNRGILLRSMGHEKEAQYDFDQAIKNEPALAEKLRAEPKQPEQRVTTQRPATRPANPFQGVWAVNRVYNGVHYDCAIEFDGNRYRYVISWVDAAGQPWESRDEGTFSVNNGVFIFSSNQGQQKQHSFGFQDGYLFISFPGLHNDFGFERVG